MPASESCRAQVSTAGRVVRGGEHWGHGLGHWGGTRHSRHSSTTAAVADSQKACRGLPLPAPAPTRQQQVFGDPRAAGIKAQVNDAVPRLAALKPQRGAQAPQFQQALDGLDDVLHHTAHVLLAGGVWVGAEQHDDGRQLVCQVLKGCRRGEGRGRSGGAGVSQARLRTQSLLERTGSSGCPSGSSCAADCSTGLEGKAMARSNALELPAATHQNLLVDLGVAAHRHQPVGRVVLALLLAAVGGVPLPAVPVGGVLAAERRQPAVQGGALLGRAWTGVGGWSAGDECSSAVRAMPLARQRSPRMPSRAVPSGMHQLQAGAQAAPITHPAARRS